MPGLRPPLPGVFVDLNSAVAACQAVALNEGYAVVKSRANKDQTQDTWKVWLECSRGTWRPSTAVVRDCGTRKNDCPFRVTIARRWNWPGSRWRLVVLDGTHNHPPDPSPIAQPMHRRMTQRTRDHIDVLYRGNQRPAEVLKIVLDDNACVLLTHQDVRNEHRRLREAELDGLTPVQALLRGLDMFNEDAGSGGYIYWYDTTDGCLDYLMWVHPNSLAMLKSNYEILMADCTYDTNKYNYPLCQITGRNTTEMTFDIGYAFIGGEGQENYDMIVRCLTQLYRDHCDGKLPNVIITDKCEALKNAFSDSAYFSAVPQIICQFHVYQNILLTASRYWSLRFGLTPEEEEQLVQAREEFMGYWRAVMFASGQTWEQAWADLEDAYTPIAPALVDYLRREWMSSRDEVLNAFVNVHRHYGVRTTSPNESAHFIMGHYVHGRAGDFLNVVKACHRRLEVMFHNINANVATSMNRNPTEAFHPLLDNVRGQIAPKAVRIISRQAERAFEAGREVVDACACYVRVQYGLPCRHSILWNLSEDPGYKISMEEVDQHFWFSRTDDGDPLVDEDITGGILHIREPPVRPNPTGRPRNPSRGRGRGRTRNYHLRRGTRIPRSPTRTPAQRGAARRAAAAIAEQALRETQNGDDNDRGEAGANPAGAQPPNTGHEIGGQDAAPVAPRRRGRPVGSRDSYRRVRHRQGA